MNLPRFLLTLYLITTVSGHNITNILSEFPEYSIFNNYLTQTLLNDDINTRQTITVLVFNNSVATNFTADQPLSVIKHALSVHILLDYFDITKLLTIENGSMTTTTLYQTTGNAAGNTGLVNITDFENGKVEFGSAAKRPEIESVYTKSVKQIPYNISVLEINSPVIALELLPEPSDVNFSKLLNAVGCRTFSKFLKSTGVVSIYEKVAEKALTVFAPSDAAFKFDGLPDLNELTNAEFVSLLLYHAIPSYVPMATLNDVNEGTVFPTLATNSAGKFAFTIGSMGNSVMLDSGVDDSRVVDTVSDLTPVSILRIDKVLLPMELFATTPAPAAAPPPELESSPPLSVSLPAPESTPIASLPAPVAGISPVASPPAPLSSPTSPISSPAASASPAESPTADMGSNTASSGDRVKVPAMFLVLLISGILL